MTMLITTLNTMLEDCYPCYQVPFLSLSLFFSLSVSLSLSLSVSMSLNFPLSCSFSYIFSVFILCFPLLASLSPISFSHFISLCLTASCSGVCWAASKRVFVRHDTYPRLSFLRATYHQNSGKSLHHQEQRNQNMLQRQSGTIKFIV